MGADQTPQAVQIDGGAVAVLPPQMEVPHAHFAEVARVVFVEVDALMVHATGVTATSGMLAVLANASMAVAHVSTQLPGLLAFDIRLQSAGKPN